MDSLQKKTVAFALYLLFGLFMWGLVNMIDRSDFSGWVDLLVVLVFAQIGIQFLLMKYLRIKVSSLIGFFLLLSYLFHFGHLLLLSTPFRNLQMGLFVIRIVGEDLFRIAITFCLYVMYSLFLGVILSADPAQASTTVTLDNLVEQRDLYMCKIIGNILIITGLPAFLYVTIKRVSAAIMGNYLAIFELRIPSYVNFMSTMLSVGICLAIIGYQNNIRISKGALFFGVSLQSLSMLSGSRGLAVIAVLLYIYIYYGIAEKIDLGKVLFLSLVAYVGLGFVSTLASIRDVGISLEAFYNEFHVFLTSKSPLLVAINEFGGTLLTPAVTIQSVPDRIKPAMGMSYLNSVLNLISVNLGPVRVESFVSLINIGAMGGSFIGELYYNFMGWGIFFSIIIGYIVSRISVKIQNALVQRKYMSIAYYLPFSIGLMWWIRDSFTYLVRISVVGGIFTFGLQFIIKSLLPVRNQDKV